MTQNQSENNRYVYDCRVRYSETDEKGCLSCAGLVNLFQDTCTFQAEDLGIGVQELKKRDLAWILLYWHIDIFRQPALGERLNCFTWPYEFKGFYGLRNFLLQDEENNAAARANSVWALMNMKEMRPVKVLPEMIGKYKISQPLDMLYLPRKMKAPENAQPRELIRVEARHLDTNHHVNNEQYIAMAMSFLGEGRRIVRLRTEYRNQARLGDVIIPMVLCTAPDPQDTEALLALNPNGNGAFDLTDIQKVKVSLQDEAGKPYAIVEMITTAQGD